MNGSVDGRGDRGEDEDADDDPRPVRPERLAGDDAGEVEQHDEDRDLEGDAEDQQRPGEEREVVAELDQVGQVRRA